MVKCRVFFAGRTAFLDVILRNSVLVFSSNLRNVNFKLRCDILTAVRRQYFPAPWHNPSQPEGRIVRDLVQIYLFYVIQKCCAVLFQILVVLGSYRRVF